MKFSKAFGLNASQGELDFVDVDPTIDKRLFVDPYAIEINSNEDADVYYEYLVSYFAALLDHLRAGRDFEVRKLVSNLKEPGETYLGFSKGSPRGKGVRGKKAAALVEAFRNSEAFKSGQMEDFTEAELFVPGVGPDGISDLSTNVLRKPLVEYTQAVCAMHGIEVRRISAEPSWNIEKLRWESSYQELPMVQGKPVMLIPKALVRRRLCLDSQEFYNYYIDFLQAELEVSVGFASALRGASGRVTKERVKEKYPFDKEALAKFATEHPDLFDEFRKIMESADGINDQSIDPDFVYSEATQSLISEIRNLPAGRKHADKYEKLVQKALTLLTWPDLTFPTAQRQLHQGTKRLDIEYWIYAKLGFWADMRTDQRVRARVVSVECKNYNDDIGNNEIDQLSGRFGRERGFLGLIFYRKVENEEKLKRRLESYVIDQRGYILAVSDKELIALLNESRVQRDKSVRHFFTEKFRRLISFA